MIVIGITGQNGSGKTSLAEYLSSKGFVFTSLSDMIRLELIKEGKTITLDALINKGNDLRQQFGGAVLAQKLIEQLKPDANYVVDSIRNPAEVLALQKLPYFRLWSVQSSSKERFNRFQARGRSGDPVTQAEFDAVEERENSTDPLRQQVNQIIALADLTIQNETSLSDFFAKVDEQLLQVPYQIERPSWDEYYMNIAKVIAHRSNCLKRRVGAVLVRDNRIVATGYNGTPRGIKNCNEGGCERCRSFMTPSGTKLDECRCSHAEENAIVQSAYHGISTKGAVLYTTFSPCMTCTKMIINAGIARVVYNANYPLAQNALLTLQESGVTIEQVKE